MARDGGVKSIWNHQVKVMNITSKNHNMTFKNVFSPFHLVDIQRCGKEGLKGRGGRIGRGWGWKRVGLGLEGGGVGRKWDWDWKGAKLEGLVVGER